MSTTTVTNNQKRPVIFWYELTEKEQEEFDYLDTPERQMGASFFRYKGNVYDLGDAMRVEPYGNTLCKGWQFYYGETFFSAVVGKFVDDHDYVIIGHVFS